MVAKRARMSKTYLSAPAGTTPQQPLPAVYYYLGYEVTKNRDSCDRKTKIITFKPKGVWARTADVPATLLVERVSLSTHTDQVSVIYHIYEHGDSLGSTQGDWIIHTAHATEDEAMTNAKLLKAKLEQQYQDDYFGSLEGVYVYTTAVIKKTPVDKIVAV